MRVQIRRKPGSERPRLPQTNATSTYNGSAPGKQTGQCPVCGNETALDVAPAPHGRWYVGCYSCEAEGVTGADLLVALADAVDAPGPSYIKAEPHRWLGDYLDDPAVTRREPQRLPSEAALAGYQSRLRSERIALAYLKGRGLYTRTIRRAGLGYDVEKHAIVIPVYADGELANVRLRFLAPGPKQPKYIGLRGRPGQLYPSPPVDDAVVLCAGEFDALVTIQHGIPAVTSTIGAGSWKPEWDRYFAGRRVAVVFDTNEYDAAVKRAEALRTVCDAWPVDLRPLLSGGKDLTDHFTCGGTAQELTAHIRSERRRAEA